MAGASGFTERMAWQRRAPGTPDAFGQRADSFHTLGDLWVAVKDSTGGRATSKESEHQVITATIRVRQYPEIRPKDRLRSYQWGDLWTVESVTRGDNEMILEVTRPKWTQGAGAGQ